MADPAPSSNWASELPARRAKPRAYGTGKYGTGKYTETDTTRYNWTRVTASLVFLLALAAGYAFGADTYTTNLNLRKPEVDVEDPVTPWGTKINDNLDLIDAGLWNIDTNKIKTDAVIGPKILDGAVSTTKVATDAVTSSKILKGAIQTEKLAADAVTTAALLNGSVETSKLAADAVDTAKLRSDSVTTPKIADATVSTSKLSTDAVTAAKILNATIGSAKLALGSVDTYRLGTDAVVSSIILNGAVQTSKLGTDAVTGASILNGTIGTAKMGFVNSAGGPAVLDASARLALGSGTDTGKIKLSAPAASALDQYELELASGSLIVNGDTTKKQAQFKGWSTTGGADIDGGEIIVGGTASGLRIQHDGTADNVYFDNLAAGGGAFRWRKAGTTEMARLNASGRFGIGPSGIDPDGPFMAEPPAAETIAAGGTISSNACGTIRGIQSTGNVTTSTTDTFTAPAASNNGCCMDVINVDSTDTITLDNNANFVSAGAADVALGPGDTVRVCSNGSKWYQIGATGNN